MNSKKITRSNLFVLHRIDTQDGLGRRVFMGTVDKPETEKMGEAARLDRSTAFKVALNESSKGWKVSEVVSVDDDRGGLSLD